MIAETIFVFYILYFIINNLIQMKKQQSKYWKSYWTLAEWAIVILAFVAGFLYTTR